MYELQRLIGRGPQLSSGESLPLEENEATLAEFYLDVEECSKHTNRLTRNLRDWKGILESAKAKGGATPSVLQGLKSSASHQIEQEDEEARRLNRLKKNALLLEKHLVRLSRLCMSQEEIIHNLRQEERQQYLKGHKDDEHGKYLLEDSSQLHSRLQELSDALEDKAKESIALKSKVSRELESRYSLEKKIRSLEKELGIKSDKLTETELSLANSESDRFVLKSRVEEAGAENARLQEELSRLDARGFLQLEQKMSSVEEDRDLTRISLQARMRDAYLDKSRLERRLRLEDNDEVRLSIEARIKETDQDRSMFRERLLKMDEEREEEQSIIVNRKFIIKQAKHMRKRHDTRMLRDAFGEWKELCLSYKRNFDPALDLQALSTSLLDYRFFTMRALAKWTKFCNDARSNRHKIAKVQKLIMRNNMMATFRAWGVHCQTLRHRRARLVQIITYFKSRTERLSFQKWKAITKKMKRLMHPHQVEMEEKSDRLKKIQLTRFGFRYFVRGAKRSMLQRVTEKRVVARRRHLMKTAVIRHWFDAMRREQILRYKERRFIQMRAVRCLKCWAALVKRNKTVNVQLARLEEKFRKRKEWEYLMEWNYITRRNMYRYWVEETWGERQAKRRMRMGLDAFKLQIKRKLRGSKFAVMMIQLNVQNLRSRAFYKWLATTVANVLSFAIQKVHDHLNTIDMGLLSMAVQYDENDPKMQDVMVIAQKIDTNLESVKAALADAHAVFKEVRRTRGVIGEYTSPIKGLSEHAAPTGNLSVQELGLSPGAQAILLKRKVLNVKGQLNSYKLSKMMSAKTLFAASQKQNPFVENEDGEEGRAATTPHSSLRSSTDLLKRSLDTAVAKLQSRSTGKRDTAGPGRGNGFGDGSITMSDVRDMYGKVSKIRKNLESELEKSTHLNANYVFSTPSKQIITSNDGRSHSHAHATPDSSGKHPWRPPGITPSPGWSQRPQD